MNLKNSRFYKRIQTLRRMSKEKLRKERERARLNWAIDNCIKEQDGNDNNNDSLHNVCDSSYEHCTKKEITDAIKLRQQQLIAQQCDQLLMEDDDDKKLSSFIHFNQSCYQIDGFTGVKPNKPNNLFANNDSLPSIK